ncbi:Ankyrin-1 [Colletotrichum fructicola]|uniref:Ankyrin unc44 n=1 Tax=Colletotrichum fructicola (strain Nara gc5) TaxID=1213859 RepID=L2G4Z7_COLFN|nr:uncharacterized protein CGMCC3_g5216 [Colletotrichum fructicola]KAF4491742.1 Ankyrin-1 [Colletotrichum fructicola Nara gc5]KAE9578878.1 hypothetical protein CGMCC3_g5216 [Colletotrichum fructicola]KAF4423570.1 Ankyrin-1 [Colletotrichum fructicola]KAF4904691.1 Ankyrin-1 [Colletotrichum fructicola]KAF4915470.1 Ankyrin-1 [Colletotrichum fructicola]
MEILGTVTSVFELCRITKDLLETFANAGQDVTQLKYERNLTELLCVTLQALIDKDPNMQHRANGTKALLMKSFRDTMEGIKSTLKLLEKKLRKLSVNADDNIIAKTRLGIYWVLNEGNFKDLLESLRNQRLMMNSFVGLYNAGQTLDVKSMLGNIPPSTPMRSGEIDPGYAEDLLKAVKGGQLDSVESVLARNGDINVALEGGDRAVHIAARKGSLPILERLLTLSADVHVSNNVRDTPLHAALKAGRIETAMALLLRGASWKSLNNDGFSPLHLAVLHSTSPVVHYLLDRGADTGLLDLKSRTPLKLAWHPLGKDGKKGTVDIDIMRALVGHGASPTPTDERGRTLVHLAVKEKRPDFVRLLASKSADMNAKTNDKSTPLHVSITSDDLPMTRLLLDLGANPNEKTVHGGSPLMFAARGGSLPMMRLLLDRGAQKFYKTPQETNAFLWACYGGHITCASFLLGCGYGPSKRAAADFTALHYAAARGHMEVVRWLLELGVNKSITSKNVRVPFKASGTAAEVARAHGHSKVAEVIETFVDEQTY